MRIQQFRFAEDNLGYLVHGKKQALAVDAGAVSAIRAYLDDFGLTLTAVANTHSHPDHTVGMRDLLSLCQGRHYTMDMLATGPDISVDDFYVNVIPTPGHSSDSVCFVAGSALLCGDTLFNGTIGNCFSGDLEGFFNSLKKLMAFEDDMTVYAGHDYVEESMAFAKYLEPNNAAIDQYLDDYNPAHVRSTLGQERRVNPYLRFNEPSIISVLEARGLPTDTEYARFASLMSIE